MKGYLVMVRYNMDDVPVALFETRRLAMKQANLSKSELHASAVIAGARMEYSDFENPIAVIVVEFQDGVPVKSSLVRVF